MKATYTSDLTVFQKYPLGHIFMITDEDPVPPGWHVLDGSKISSAEYPAYAQKLGASKREITLTEPRRVPEGMQFIIKIAES